MNKKVIRLTETDLHDIVRGSIKKVLKEEEYLDFESLKWKEAFSLMEKLKERLEVCLMDDGSDNDAWGAYWNLYDALEYRMERPLDH